MSGKSNENLNRFTNRLTLIGARPAIKIRYIREPYESILEPARITIDTRVQYSEAKTGDLTFSAGSWKPTPVHGSIIEVKFTENLPGWVSDLVRTFSLNQQPVPKYGLSVHALLNHHGTFDHLTNGLRIKRKGE
jgi:hypothetical protein